jgi:hypothetical protein
MVKKITALLIAFLFLAVIRLLTAFAVQSTSTDFSVCANAGYIVGNSTSSDFGLFSYGQTDALPISSSSDFMVNPGIEAIFGCAAATPNQSISLTVSPSTVTLPGLSPGVPVTATTTVTVITSGANNGYFLQINRNSATSTLASSSISFPDAAVWNPLNTTCASGVGNATTVPGQNFSFRVASTGTTASYCSFWWGTTDTSTAMYAGVPAAGATIVNSTNAQSQNGSTAVSIIYRVDAPATTTITTYTGNITVTAIANP